LDGRLALCYSLARIRTRRDMPLPDPARYARDAAQAIGATYQDLDNGENYLFRIAKNARFVVAGAGPVASFPVNSASAVSIARDKSFTNAVLADAGLPVIPGGLFFAHQRRVSLRGPGREVSDARLYAARLGWPVFCKPNTGARGNFAEIIPNDAALVDYAARVAVEFEAFLIQPVVRGAEHRVLIHDGRPIFHAAKQAPVLVGDGRRTLAELLATLNAELAGTGISEWPASVFALQGRTAGDVMQPGERFILPGRRNLSAVGEIERFRTDVPAPLLAIARAAVAAVGLRIGAVDMFDRSAAGDLSDLVVIEVNGNPGLKTLELAGRMDLIRAIWTDMLKELLGA
jgi:glutathione synthase/RimK-type ligase-like ATP-grasp enzyme